MRTRAFVWDPEFGFLDLGLYSTTGRTEVIDMNESGQIIGASITSVQIVQGNKNTTKTLFMAPCP